MTDERIRRLLDQRAPDERSAEERGWHVVRTGFAQRSTPPRRARARRTVIALAAALALIAAAFTPPGQAVTDWVRDAVSPGRDDARPALASLPGAGRLLVTSKQGPWIVQQDGSRRLLGSFDDASWSPGGLFVAATRGRELVALEPGGRPRWSLARSGPVANPRWSPDGFRIAYLAGRDLRVVAGDGTGDALLARSVPLYAPAWRPRADHELAFADSAGRIRVVQTDSRTARWRSDAAIYPRQLEWSADGQRLLALAPEAVYLFDAGGRLVASEDMPPGTAADAAAFARSGHSFALASHQPKLARTRLAVVVLGKGATWERLLLSGAGRFEELAWSPNGRWLLASWPSANQWVFIRAEARRRGGIERLRAVANISEQFSPGVPGGAGFPHLGGWCCRR